MRVVGCVMILMVLGVGVNGGLEVMCFLVGVVGGLDGFVEEVVVGLCLWLMLGVVGGGIVVVVGKLLVVVCWLFNFEDFCVVVMVEMVVVLKVESWSEVVSWGVNEVR